ncbi:ABC transporter substrate-binding protein [Paenibacillus radicis (ex Xue et al. 2023)]|uniref:ABC transporter substrate-binding protein n=1 Tax=Paenibacillus radicis (ex Xue et al. 2023) TaxID=2972489 RepID=A0ABT1YQ44_9BACL|nr:ABC transporter substrate-binding protein [Paenibacillus radicis (ex Xue et al. 2023)]MCR8635299.1 ABC transporter substrate-binding protein [Paenibacillus radicis (ex Xue et al. 2023)]
MKMSKGFKNGALLMLTAMVGFGVAGCGTTEKPANTNASAPKAEQPVQPAKETKVEEKKEEKKLSGKLVVYSAGPKELAEAIQKGYETKTGVKIEMFQGTTGKILSRMEAEKANPAVDVVVLASLPSTQGLKKSGMTLEYKDAKNADKLIPEWSDKEGHFYGYSASALGIGYNTKLVKTPPKEWDDLTKEEWKGKVNIPDPALSGSALDFVTGYLSMKGDSGWQLLEQYKKNGVAMAGANQEALDPVITGSKSIIAAGVDYLTYQAKAKGEPVDMLYPASGTVISPRPAAIIKTSKNVDNAKAYIDYLLSDEAQKLVAETYLLPGRKDVKAKDRPGVDQIPQMKIDWTWMDTNGDAVTKKFTQLFK